MARLTFQQLIDERIRYRLNYLNTVECWNHLGRLTSATAISFPYQNWNTSPSPVFRKNGTIITPDSIDSTNGTIVVTSLVAGDDVTADYSFKYFTDEVLTSFINNSLSRYNFMPPNNAFTEASYPEYITDWLVSMTYAQCLRTILMDLTMWKARLIFTDPQMLASNVQAILNSIESENAKVAKPRSINAAAVTMGRWRLPQYVSESTWQNFTVMRYNS